MADVITLGDAIQIIILLSGAVTAVHSLRKHLNKWLHAQIAIVQKSVNSVETKVSPLIEMKSSVEKVEHALNPDGKPSMVDKVSRIESGLRALAAENKSLQQQVRQTLINQKKIEDHLMNVAADLAARRLDDVNKRYNE